jgi:hypothetical protein
VIGFVCVSRSHHSGVLYFVEVFMSEPCRRNFVLTSLSPYEPYSTRCETLRMSPHAEERCMIARCENSARTIAGLHNLSVNTSTFQQDHAAPRESNLAKQESQQQERLQHHNGCRGCRNHPAPSFLFARMSADPPA